MKKYFINDTLRNEVNQVLNTHNERLGILSKEQVCILINKNLLKEYTIEIPYEIKLGDWVRCLEQPSFDFSSFTPFAKNITHGTAWEKDKVFKVTAVKWGGGVVEDEHGVGTYLSWVEPMTDEEVKLHFEKQKV